MDFSGHLRTVFAARGAAAIYTPPLGEAISCNAIRQGGGQPVRVGPVLVTSERISFHVRRADIASPLAGATMLYRGETFTVDACQPVERDAEGLMWSLDVSWGAQMTYRTVTGSGSVQNPPQGSDYVVAAHGEAGASTVSIKSNFSVGKLLAGDKITIGATEHTVTGAGVQAAAGIFAAVPVTPPLVASVEVGAPVSLTYACDLPLRGAVASYAANEFMGGVLAGDRRIVIMQAALQDAGFMPKAGDRLLFEGRTFNVQSAVAIYQGASAVAWDVQVRG